MIAPSRGLPLALPVRSVETGALFGWYPDRGVYDVQLHMADDSRAVLLTKRPDGRAWLTSNLALSLLSRLPDFVPREECYAMPEPTEGRPR